MRCGPADGLTRAVLCVFVCCCRRADMVSELKKLIALEAAGQLEADSQ